LKFLTRLNIVALLIPKGKRNRENKLNLNEETILCLLDKEKTLSIAAAKAGMDEKTARKYRRAGKLPSQMAKGHIWRTRKNPFWQIWPWVAENLKDNPGLEAKTLFEALQRDYPGRFPDGQLRTLQRHVKAWRATEGPSREIFFTQVYRPGEWSSSDFTSMNMERRFAQMAGNKDLQSELIESLKALHLPTVRQYYRQCAQMAANEDLSYEQYLLELVERECEVRRANKIKRLLRSSRLPLEKSLAVFDLKRLPVRVRQQVKVLLEGGFLERNENVLAFGNPGSGKTHLLCAIGQELIHQGYSVYFTTCSLLVQELLRAKRDLKLDKILKKFSKYDALLIDDIGYVQQERQEMEVLFTLLAQRYEYGSVMLTSNLPFSKWDAIFKDPMTTAAAIDRLVHHSVILELNISSYRVKHAKATKNKAAG